MVKYMPFVFSFSILKLSYFQLYMLLYLFLFVVAAIRGK